MIKINTLNDLRIFAECYIEECNNTHEDKIKFINFIKEANESQISTLLTKGKMVSDRNKLSEAPGPVDIYKGISGTAKHIKHLQGTGAAAQYVAGQTLPVAAVLAALTYAGIKAYKNYLSKAAKACSGKKGDEKKACMDKFKKEGIKQKIKYLEAGKARCKHSKNPETCVKKIELKVAKLKQQI